MDRSAAILAGGRGRRMGGVNKALLRWGSDVFIDRQIRICSAWTEELIVVSNDEAFAQQLRQRHGLFTAADHYPGEGPLAGLHAGLTAASRPYVWLLACDQPLASAQAASFLHERIKSEHAMAALPVMGGRPQPLHAVYRREAAEIAGTLLRQGERRLLALLDQIPWIAVSGEQFAQNGIDPVFVEDVDTPGDYDRIRGVSPDNEEKERLP